MKKRRMMIITALILSGALAGCGSAASVNSNATENSSAATTQAGTTASSEDNAGETIASAKDTNTTASSEDTTAEAVSIASVSSNSWFETADLFSERDLTQTADLSGAETITVTDGQNVTISKEGIYVITGTASGVTVYVEAGDSDKVQLVLNGVSITNDTVPCIYVKSADKVFITTTEGSENSLSVTGTFTADGDTNTDAVIFSKEDLVLNGQGSLNINSTDNAVTSKDDLKVTGGTYTINCSGSALEAHDSIRVAGGTIDIQSANDGLHAEDDDDDTTGYIYISGGTITINAKDDGVHATTYLQVDNGDLTVKGAEGMEATKIRINGGNISIEASDDGINAAKKSTSIGTPEVEINGGSTTIVMGQGDTDGVDSNGNITINGGTVDITGQSTFDYDGTGTINGGTVIENGKEVTTLSNQFGGGGQGGRGGFGGRDFNNGEAGKGFGGNGFPGGDFDAGDFNGEMPEGADGQQPPEGFDRQQPQKGFDGQQPFDGNFPGGRNSNGKPGRGGRNTEEATTESE